MKERLPVTPAIEWPLLGRLTGTRVWVKHENALPTGAFKVRGGVVLVDRLQRAGGVPGIVSATRGNHGQSLAFAAGRAGLPVTIVVPHGNSPGKNAAMRALGALLVEHGEDFDEARAHAADLAGRTGALLVPSFHPDLVDGVATYWWELFAAVPDLDTVYVPIGMGSGICAGVLVRDALGLPTRIVGVQADGAPSYALSFAAGHVVSTPRADTLADGMATRVPSPEALAVIRRGVDRIVTVSDDAIADAILALWDATHHLAEGAGAAGLAALRAEGAGVAGARVGLVLTGGNLDLDLFRTWVLPRVRAGQIQD